MEWIESLGGPLVLMEESFLPFWEGANRPDPRRRVYADSRASLMDRATDYDRACDIKRMLGILEVGPGIAIVLSGETLPATWWPFLERRGGLIVRWMYAAGDDAVAKHLLQVPDASFSEAELRFDVRGPLVLFDSVLPGYEITSPYLRVDLVPGSYGIQTALYQPDQQTSLVIHRFTNKD